MDIEDILACLKRGEDITASQAVVYAQHQIKAAVADERKWHETYLRALKGELNGMALIGVKPMWGSLIGRLEQMIADAKARTV